MEKDAHGVRVVVRVEARIALACCDKCGSRVRVLPCDIQAHKLYAVAVIELLVATYTEGDTSLRVTAWRLAGIRTPAFTTLHAWSEGMGAYALGRRQGELPEGRPHAALVQETEARLPEAREVPTPEVDERRYRSEARRDRLGACARLLLTAALATKVSSPFALVGWCALALSWSRSAPLLAFTSPILFRTGLSSTGFERVGASVRARSPPK